MPSNNRIGEPCWYKTTYTGEWRGGRLRYWGSEGDGDSSYPAGVVEDDESHACHSVYAEHISFAGEQPQMTTIA